MTRFLLAADSVHTAAAACDYLARRLTGDDAVLAVTVEGESSDADRRDGADALNVATVRLSGAARVETESVEGDPAESILAIAAERGIDEIVIGARGGAPGSPGSPEGVGRTARAVIARADVPVVVVPMPTIE